ncbi:MAG: hypothetical protein WCO33_03080, partial [bacterium]
MDKSISSKLIELNKNFYNNCADDFSTSRNKHYWNLFNYTLEDCKSNFFELEDNNIFIIGNLSSEFLNKDEIKILDLG